MADSRFNRLLIMPFQERWAARDRLRKGQPLFGGFSMASTAGASGSASEGSWQAKPPPVPVDATAEAFKLLGLVEATATEDDVKRRFKDLAFQHHPDRGGDVQKFHAISEAKDRCLKVLKARSVLST
jgi:hypothetical protein